MALFNLIKRNHTENKNFSYSKDKVSLNFTLRIDIKQELKDFKELLEIALVEVEKEIEKINNK